MAHRDQVRRLLSRHDARYSRDLKRVALGIFRERLEYGGFHRDERARLGFAVSHRFVADVHHARLAGTVVMGELAGHEEISYRERVSEFQKVAPAPCRLEPA